MISMVYAFCSSEVVKLVARLIWFDYFASVFISGA